MTSKTIISIRFRQDNPFVAAARVDHLVRWGDVEEEVWEATPPPCAGDVWSVYWATGTEEGEKRLAGYAICCPGCGRVHYWTTASNCSSAYSVEGGGVTCDHVERRESCWRWTGDAQEGTLSAVPSLLSRTCGWHGHLVRGRLIPC